MAELSRFFGIIIRMFAEHGVRHHKPHFHGIYQDYEAVFNQPCGNPIWFHANQTTTIGDGMGRDSSRRTSDRMGTSRQQ